MNDYIDRDELQTMIKELKREGYDEYMFGSNYTVLDAVKNAVKELPSIDAVEVVRCIKCKYSKYLFINGLCDGLFCYKIGRPIDDDFFCKWGEKE